MPKYIEIGSVISDKIFIFSCGCHGNQNWLSRQPESGMDSKFSNNFQLVLPKDQSCEIWL